MLLFAGLNWNDVVLGATLLTTGAAASCVLVNATSSKNQPMLFRRRRSRRCS